MERMEATILRSFKKTVKEARNLNLIVSLPDDFYEDYECEVMEKKDNGKVWAVKCSKVGTVKAVMLL